MYIIIIATRYGISTNTGFETSLAGRYSLTCKCWSDQRDEGHLGGVCIDQ